MVRVGVGRGGLAGYSGGAATTQDASAGGQAAIRRVTWREGSR